MNPLSHFNPMSKRVRDNTSDPELVDLHSNTKIFLPDLPVNFGSYGMSSKSIVMNMRNETTDDNVTQVNDDIDMDIDNHDLYDNYYEEVDNEINEINDNDNDTDSNDNELYEEPNFSDSIFNDQFLFEDGLLISKGNNSVDLDVQMNEPLFEGSNSTLKDFCRYMLILKISQNLGDVTFSIIVGSILAFLPEKNGLREFIHENPTMYDINKAITTLSDVTDCCRVFKKVGRLLFF